MRLPETQNFAILKDNSHLKSIVIAIDGPAASGKTTTARKVADALGYLHVDTGAMYRALTLRVLEEKLPMGDEAAIQALAERTTVRLKRTNGVNAVFVDERDVTKEIRKPTVTKYVSKVSSYPGVRKVMVREQRKLAAEGGIVLEGRDIGTVVLPDADLKIFMVANVGERARRRKRELEGSGIEVDENVLAREIEERDLQDSTREVSPLRKAADAIEVDTSNLTIEQQVQLILARARERISS